MRRYNQRLYRLARSGLRDDADAEEAVQQAYVNAFAGIGRFRQESTLATWLSRIVINVALDGLRKRRSVEREVSEAATVAGSGGADALDPERSMAQRQIQILIERAIDELPEMFRTVLVARLVEGLSVEATAELLGLRPETVKTRLHRARTQVKRALERQLGPAITGVFPFLGRRCELLADSVIERLRRRH
jgi:RNA polymerase sigma-70 factor (ECF subfamily)